MNSGVYFRQKETRYTLVLILANHPGFAPGAMQEPVTLFDR